MEMSPIFNKFHPVFPHLARVFCVFSCCLEESVDSRTRVEDVINLDKADDMFL